jgi:hypothetical protein
MQSGLRWFRIGATGLRDLPAFLSHGAAADTARQKLARLGF